MPQIPREIRLGWLCGHEVRMLKADHATFVKIVDPRGDTLEFDLEHFQNMVEQGQKSLVTQDKPRRFQEGDQEDP